MLDLLLIGLGIVAIYLAQLVLVAWWHDRRERRRGVYGQLRGILDALESDRDAVLDDMAQGGKR